MKKYAIHNHYAKDLMVLMTLPQYRNLALKQQVFHNQDGGKGYIYRNRLTHSNEVAALSSYVAARLGLNHELAALLGHAHDIGHSCFGHCGQDTLDSIAKNNGENGFEHNAQAIRILTVLNPTQYQFSQEMITGLSKTQKSGLKTPNNFGESQVMDICDAIAYTCSDLQDALHMKMITIDDLQDLNFIKVYADDEHHQQMYWDLHHYFTHALIQNSQNNIKKHKIVHFEDFCENPTRLITFNEEINQQFLSLKKFMLNKVYHHKDMLEIQDKHITLLYSVFNAFMGDKYELLGNGTKKRIETNEVSKVRGIIDFIAGCDDKYITDFYNLIKE